MRSEKIILIVPRFPVASETFIVNKFVGLIQKGLDVHIVCQKIEKNLWNHFEALKQHSEYRKRVHGLPLSESKLTTALFFPWVFIKTFFMKPVRSFQYLAAALPWFGWSAFARFYRDSPIILLKPEVIHFEFGALAVGREYLKEILRCKMTVSFRGYDLNFSGLENPFYYEKVWKTADAVHCLGEDLWRRAIERGCPADKKNYRIAPAIDAEFFKRDTPRLSPLVGGAGKMRILSVGRLEWKKGYEYALQAVKILKDQGLSIKYRIIGDGAYFEAICFCRHQLGLENEVELLGTRSSDEIKGEMEKADIFVHSAVSEGFCNAVMEAQSMELPIVCTDADGLPENIQHEVTGFVVPRRDSEVIAEKIKQLIQNPEMRTRMGQNGRQRVVEKFQLKNRIKEFEKFYESI